MDRYDSVLLRSGLSVIEEGQSLDSSYYCF